jgi:hypothetical protein
MKTKYLLLGLLLGLLLSAIVVFFLPPYAITTTGGRSFKINRLTGASWVFHWETGPPQWVPVPNR